MRTMQIYTKEGCGFSDEKVMVQEGTDA